MKVKLWLWSLALVSGLGLFAIQAANAHTSAVPINHLVLISETVPNNSAGPTWYYRGYGGGYHRGYGYGGYGYRGYGYGGYRGYYSGYGYYRGYYSGYGYYNSYYGYPYYGSYYGSYNGYGYPYGNRTSRNLPQPLNR